MADYGVSYNGVLLQTAIPGAQVIDVAVQPIPIMFTKLDRAAVDGSLLVRRKLLERTVKISVELPLNPALGQFAGYARLLRNWADYGVELPLTLPDYPGKYLNCALTNINDISLKSWHNPVELTFTAYDEPCFLSSTESTASVNASFTVAGDLPVRPVITHVITTALQNPSWSLNQANAISLIGTFESGTITIDMKKGYVRNGSNSLMQYLTGSSRFFELKKGANTITGPSGGTVKWRERWVD